MGCSNLPPPTFLKKPTTLKAFRGPRFDQAPRKQSKSNQDVLLQQLSLLYIYLVYWYYG